MEYVTLGETGLLASNICFAPVQSENQKDSSCKVDLLKTAYNAGVNLFDTRYSLPFSQSVVATALQEKREDILLSSSLKVSSPGELLLQTQEILTSLKTQHIDLLKIENPKNIFPKTSPLYDQLLTLKEMGKIKHIGLSTSDIDTAFWGAAQEGIFEVIQFPFSVLSDKKVQDLVALCNQKSIGFIAQSPLCGGLVQNIPLALGFLSQFENIVSLWSPQNEQELEQILYFASNPPVIDEQFKKDAQKEQAFFN